jgi:hypothetical protein
MLIKDSTRLLDEWYNLRQQLENTDTPFEMVAAFFEKRPKVKIYTDPYDTDTWPTPWELIEENEYCPFNLVLGICYTLQLTDRFKDCHPKINVVIDNNNKTVYYILIIKDKVYGYDSNWININNLPNSLKIQKIYRMKALH